MYQSSTIMLLIRFITFIQLSFLAACSLLIYHMPQYRSWCTPCSATRCHINASYTLRYQMHAICRFIALYRYEHISIYIYICQGFPKHYYLRYHLENLQICTFNIFSVEVIQSDLFIPLEITEIPWVKSPSQKMSWESPTPKNATFHPWE